ncbi:MAG: squalene/phytoene synthase family protein [Candidatus Eremiobacteraeota bacterium]|nr:squalene/phytoene synthase family protein [Candidatus Eremiobacteraeota bacterium]MBC5804380.1 squalene/phytoene synthase family protein [Candidatus Eremiobacteraeota bacterium]
MALKLTHPATEQSGDEPGPRASRREQSEALDFARDIISRVSRTFAIGINVLPGDLGKAVLVGYLLCRIADTIEDDGAASAQRRQYLLARFLECFNDSGKATTFAAEASDIQADASYLELMNGTGLVFELLHSLPRGSAEIVERWTRELALGMSEFVGRYPAGIRIQTMPEYRRYCYYVAGTVGHLLTDLWLFHSPQVRPRDHARLLVNCEAFGEALQTINILKDIAWDIEHENAAYVPEDLLRARGSSHQTILHGDWRVQNREALAVLTQLAREDMRKSLDYFNAIPRMALQIRLFCLLPILFAVATLREIERSTAMLQSGGNVKISRAEVRSLILAGSVSTISNKTTRWLVSKTSRQRFGLGLAKP